MARLRPGAAAGITCALLLVACGDDSPSTPVAADGEASGPLGELTAAAQDEGSLTWYTVIPGSVAQEVADAFRDEYGIEVEFLEVAGSQLLDRYASEAEAGAAGADVVTAPSVDRFVADAIEQEWVVPLAEADVPSFEGYPDEYKDENLATVAVWPWVLAYNRDRLGSGPEPESFEALADDRFEGEVLLPSPSASDPQVQFWLAMEDAYGSELLEGVAGNDPDYFESSGPAIAALAAGEGTITGPTTGATAAGVIGEGAPVELVVPDATTGIEIETFLSADSASPNAARLFVEFLLSDGNELLNPDPATSFSPLDPASIPADYQPPAADVTGDKDRILSIFE